MVLSLTLICAFAAAALGGVYTLTKEPIEQAKQLKQTEAIAKVLPPYSTLSGPEEVGANIIHIAYDEQSEVVGAAVETSENGFGGKFRLIVGFDRTGNIVSYEVLEHQETPGLGSHMVDWFKTDKNNQSICGKSPATYAMRVSKEEGGKVDAITAATISSKAFLLAVNNAYDAFKQAVLADATSALDTLSQASDTTNLILGDTLITAGDSLTIDSLQLSSEQQTSEL